MAHGMFEPDTPRMKAYAAVLVGTRRAVFQVAAKWKSYRRKLTPYLMVAAGFQIDLREHVIFSAREYRIMRANGWYGRP